MMDIVAVIIAAVIIIIAHTVKIGPKKKAIKSYLSNLIGDT